MKAKTTLMFVCRKYEQINHQENIEFDSILEHRGRIQKEEYKLSQNKAEATKESGYFNRKRCTTARLGSSRS